MATVGSLIITIVPAWSTGIEPVCVGFFIWTPIGEGARHTYIIMSLQGLRHPRLMAAVKAPVGGAVFMVVCLRQL